MAMTGGGNIMRQGPPVPGNGAAPVELPPLPVEPPPVINGLTLTEFDDGSVELSPLIKGTGTQNNSDKFEENLATEGMRGTLGSDLIQGIEADERSRSDYISNYTKGLDLLGLKVEEQTNTRGQRRGVSRVNHTLLLESIVQFQSISRGEMMPAGGPCKVQTLGGAHQNADDLAQALEQDMNNYLTNVDKGNYPDFDRGLFALGYSGNLFRKPFFDPIRGIPVVRSIGVEDLIVSEDAADLDSALRVTQRAYMQPYLVKRYQENGTFLSIDLPEGSGAVDQAKQKQGSIMGVTTQNTRPGERDHTILSCYTDLDPLRDIGRDQKGAPSDQLLPYKVTIDKDSQRVLEIRRNWKKDDKLFVKRQRFVHYGLVPAFGFLCLGYLHLLGNQTKVLRAIWRLLVDAGMFANFPGGIKAKGIRTATNEISPGPGEWVEADVPMGDDIRNLFMPMPYKDVSGIFVEFAKVISGDARSLGSAPLMEVGEGRTNIPVGTIMTMVEQSTQNMAAVHKRLHSAQAQELQLLRELFLEHPETLTRYCKDPARVAYTVEQLESADIVPASDPNIPSQMHRMMLATALMQVAANNPLYDQRAVNLRAWRTVGVNDIESLMTPQGQGAGTDPEALAKIAEFKQKADELAFKREDAKRKAAHELLEAQQEDRQRESEMELERMKAGAEMALAQLQNRTEQARLQLDAAKLVMQQQQHRESLQAQLAQPKPTTQNPRSKSGAGKSKGKPKP
jgi:hypothetical protein